MAKASRALAATVSSRARFSPRRGTRRSTGLAPQPGQPGPQPVGALGQDGQEHLPGDLVAPVAVQLLHEGGGQGGVEGLDLVDHEPAPAHDPALADVEHLHRRLQVVLGKGGDVEVLGGRGHHLLALHGLADAAQLVAEAGRQLEVELLGGLAHLGLEPLQGRPGAALREDHEVLDDAPVLLRRDLADARPRALADVEQDAGPAQPPVPVEHPLGAGPHGERSQEQVQGLADGVGVGVGAEVPGPLALGPGRPAAGGSRRPGHGQPRVRLVVAVADVVAGPVLLIRLTSSWRASTSPWTSTHSSAADASTMAAVRGCRLRTAGSSWPSACAARSPCRHHPPVPVTEEVDAGMVGNRLGLRPWAGRDGHAAILGLAV